MYVTCTNLKIAWNNIQIQVENAVSKWKGQKGNLRYPEKVEKNV